jgi:hypothetical protein
VRRQSPTEGNPPTAQAHQITAGRIAGCPPRFLPLFFFSAFFSTLSGSVDGGDDEFFDVLLSFSSNYSINAFISSILPLTLDGVFSQSVSGTSVL